MKLMKARNDHRLRLPSGTARCRTATSSLPARRPYHPQTTSSHPVDRYAATQPARSVTFADLLRFGHPPVLPDKLVESAEITRQELPHRLARRVRAHYGLPYLPASNPSLAQVCETYRKALEEIEQIPPITTLKENAKFVKQLEEWTRSAAEAVPMLAKGFQETKRYLSEDQISAFLDRAIRNRIAIRLIAEQHIALTYETEHIEKGGRPESDCIGVVDLELQPRKLIEGVAKYVSELCEGTFGQAPEWVFDGEVDVKVSYVGMHLEYIMTELLKNAFRATVEHHRKVTDSSSPKLPPIFITISTTTVQINPRHSADRYGSSPPRTFSPTMFVPQEPPEPTTRSTLCIRVRDCGGGIPPEHMKDVFSYAFTTVGKAEPGDDDDGGSGSGPYETGTGGGASVISQTGMQTGLGTLAGLGYGLPMALTYCRYFGGSLDLVTLPGLGVDAYVTLPLGHRP